MAPSAMALWMQALGGMDLEEEEAEVEAAPVKEEPPPAFLVLEGFGTLHGRDALTLEAASDADLEAAKDLCRTDGYSAFAVREGVTYFKADPTAACCAGLFFDGASRLFLKSTSPAAFLPLVRVPEAGAEGLNLSGIWHMMDEGSGFPVEYWIHHEPGSRVFAGRGGDADAERWQRSFTEAGSVSAQGEVQWVLRGGINEIYQARITDPQGRGMVGIRLSADKNLTVKGVFSGVRREETTAAMTPSSTGGRLSLQAMLAGPGELAAPGRPGPGELLAVRTCALTNEFLATLPPFQWEARRADDKDEQPAVVLDSSVRFQSFLGFGGSFTESAAELLLQLSPGNQERIVDACFRADRGLGYRLGRLHINSCDFSEGNWSCCDREGDVELESFSMERYEKAILPLVRRAAAAAGAPLGLMASPWSPPAWMKDNNQMTKGGRLKPELRWSWAQFYVRFARGMEAAGLPLAYLTVQNEPGTDQRWESCLFTGAEERDFVRDHLGPALRDSGLELKLLIWDHNRDHLLRRAREVYSDPAAADFVWGAAFHWYGDPRYETWPLKAGQLCLENPGLVHQLRPDKHLIMTEGCQEKGPKLGEWFVGERYAENIISDLSHWTEGWIDWNIILDTQGGPNHKENFCAAPIIVDPAHDSVLFQPSYYYIAHFSRHIQVGAQRILSCTCYDDLRATAFENPDGSIVAVVLNLSDQPLGFKLEHGEKAASVAAPAHSITTFTIPAEGAP